MKISIITATFNSEDSIVAAIESVNNQTYNNIEHVFVDGGSADSTVQMIRDYSQRNPIIISEKDNGIYDALNKGISKCTGKIIGFVHSDDILASKFVLAKIANVFIDNNTDGVYGDLRYISKTNSAKIIRYWKGKEFTPNLLNNGWMPAHPTLYLKNSVYEKHGVFNLKYKIAADYDFILRILSDVTLHFTYMPMLICDMQVGGESNRSFTNILLKSKEDFQALKANGIGFPLKSLILKNLTKIPQFVGQKLSSKN